MPPDYLVAFEDKPKLRSVARSLAQQISAPLLVRMIGELGAGKTTLVKEIMQEWGIGTVTSPTFNLRNEYDCGLFRVLHLDLYRLKTADSAADLLPVDEDYSNAVVFVEWAEKAPQELFAFFPRRAELCIEVLPDQARKITLRYS